MGLRIFQCGQQLVVVIDVAVVFVVVVDRVEYLERFNSIFPPLTEKNKNF